MFSPFSFLLLSLLLAAQATPREPSQGVFLRRTRVREEDGPAAVDVVVPLDGPRTAVGLKVRELLAEQDALGLAVELTVQRGAEKHNTREKGVREGDTS